MTRLDSASVKRNSVLSEVRPVDNELMVFGNRERIKVECIGNLGLMRNVKVLANLTNNCLGLWTRIVRIQDSIQKSRAPSQNYKYLLWKREP